MKKTLFASVAAMLGAASAAHAGDIGVTIASNDTFLAVMTQAMKDEAAKKGVKLQVEIADSDVNKQISQVQNFVASKVDAIVVNIADSTASPQITKIAADANIPLVYVNNTPSDLDKLGAKAAFVGSKEIDAGTLETKEICDRLKAAGKTKDAGILVMQGNLAEFAAQQRTKAVHDVIATSECNFMKIIDQQTASWDPVKAQDLMTNWISAGYKPAAVIANNDDMALGAIASIKAAGLSPKDILVAGVDATQEAMTFVKSGEEAATVYQDAVGQGAGSVDLAIKLSKGEKVERETWIPFELVNAGNVDKFMKKN
jgi:ABC-type sugar transport system substrate-binding protein